MKGDLTIAQLSKALFSSTKEDWATPQDFFNKLDEEFHFDLDPCADAENAKCMLTVWPVQSLRSLRSQEANHRKFLQTPS